MSDFDFNNARLADFDPSKPLPEDTYTFVIGGAELHTYTRKTGPKAGEEGQRMQVRLIVTDHETLSGRSKNVSFFGGAGAMKIFSKLERELGIKQEEGESVVDWLNRVANQQPPALIQIPVTVQDSNYYKDDQDNPMPENNFAWFEATGV